MDLLPLDILELPSDASLVTSTPVMAEARNCSQSDHRSPPKIQMTPEARARMEENRLRAKAIKASVRQAQNAHHAAEANKKRTAGETWLNEFGLKQKKIIPVRTKSDPIQQNAMKSRIEEAISESERQVAIEPYAPDPRCSVEQMKVLDEVRLGRNVFFTGSAGVGKSFMLNEVVRMLKASRRLVSVTAPTGIAALAIEGTTIYSWAKIGLGRGSVHELYNLNSSGRAFKDKSGAKSGGILGTHVLIIDEISMLDPGLFEKLSLLCQAIRGNRSAFGGIQLILSGDFFQLPPVSKDEDFSCMWCGCPGLRRDQFSGSVQCVRPLNKDWKGTPCGRERPEYTFCFETPTWRQLNLCVIELQKVFRQEDQYFISILNKIRWGHVDKSVEDLMKEHVKPLQEHKIKPTRLYPRNQNVDVENSKQFGLLKDKAYSFAAFDTVSQSRYAQTFVSRLNDLQARKTLQLKIGTQVILLANLDLAGKLVNGSRGVVIDWRQRPDYEDTNPGKKSEHRDDAACNAGRIAWSQTQNHTYLPEVLFSDGRIAVIEPYIWKLEISQTILITRTQLPLGHAWALTIHKSQGQSLDRLCVDLRGVFECGQAYVALSRARSLEGLEVNGWHPSSVRASPLVEKFYTSITHGTPFGDLDAPFRNLDEFFPISDDGGREPVLINPNVPSCLPSVSRTWGTGLNSSSSAGPSASWHHHAPISTQPQLIDLTSPDPTPPCATAARDPGDTLEEDEWNISTQMSPSSPKTSQPCIQLLSHQEGSSAAKPDAPAGRADPSSAMKICTAHVSHALTQIVTELAILPEHEREHLDVDSLATHAAEMIRNRLSGTRSSSFTHR